MLRRGKIPGMRMTGLNTCPDRVAGCGGSLRRASAGTISSMNPPLWMDYMVGFGETINLDGRCRGSNSQAVEEDTRCPLNDTVPGARQSPGSASRRSRHRVRMPSSSSTPIRQLTTSTPVRLLRHHRCASWNLILTLDPQTGTSAIPDHATRRRYSSSRPPRRRSPRTSMSILDPPTP